MINEKKSLIWLAALFLFLIVSSIVIKTKETAITKSDDESVCRIAFTDSSIYVDNESMAIAQGTDLLTIGKEGTYYLSGSSSNARIVVDTTDLGDVNIVLSDLNISCKNQAPFYAKKCKKIKLTLEGENTLTDGESYTFEEGASKPNACFYSSKDVTVDGEGILNVTGMYHNGIAVKADLKINSGTINVQSNNNGIDVKDSLDVYGGNINITAKKDGINCKDKDDASKGNFNMTDGVVNITSGDEGIFAANSIDVSNGSIKIKSDSVPIKCDGKEDIKDECIEILYKGAQ